MSLIDKLLARQQELELNDREMAERLGVTRSVWTRVRLNLYPGVEESMVLVRGAIRGFPELTPEALLFLRDGMAIEKKEA
jgi:hypothetical protein